MPYGSGSTFQWREIGPVSDAIIDFTEERWQCDRTPALHWHIHLEDIHT